METEKVFKLKGRTLAIIDWANVFGWTKKLKWQVCPQKLFNYLKSYENIYDVRFYFGVERGNRKSEEFQQEIRQIGYILVSKEVKWVPINLEDSHFRKVFRGLQTAIRKWGKDTHNGLHIDGTALGEYNFDLSMEERIKEIKAVLSQPLWRRKCDFDIEIAMDTLLQMDNFDGLILFSGDGDYKALVEYCLNMRKKIIIVHPFNLRGKEYNEFLKRQGNKPFFYPVNKLGSVLKKSPEG